MQSVVADTGVTVGIHLQRRRILRRESMAWTYTVGPGPAMGMGGTPLPKVNTGSNSPAIFANTVPDVLLLPSWPWNVVVEVV